MTASGGSGWGPETEGPMSHRRRIHARRRRKPAKAAPVTPPALFLNFEMPEDLAIAAEDGAPAAVPAGAVPAPGEEASSAAADEEEDAVEARRRGRHRHRLDAIDARSVFYMGLALLVALLVFAVLNLMESRDLALPPPLPVP